MTTPIALADGTHASGLRWWVHRIEGHDAPLVTVSGFDGPQYLFRQAHFQDAGPERAARFADQVLAAARARRQRR